jgi:hypothetical protein
MSGVGGSDWAETELRQPGQQCALQGNVGGLRHELRLYGALKTPDRLAQAAGVHLALRTDPGPLCLPVDHGGQPQAGARVLRVDRQRLLIVRTGLIQIVEHQRRMAQKQVDHLLAVAVIPPLGGVGFPEVARRGLVPLRGVVAEADDKLRKCARPADQALPQLAARHGVLLDVTQGPDRRAEGVLAGQLLGPFQLPLRYVKLRNKILLPFAGLQVAVDDHVGANAVCQRCSGFSARGCGVSADRPGLVGRPHFEIDRDTALRQCIAERCQLRVERLVDRPGQLGGGLRADQAPLHIAEGAELGHSDIDVPGHRGGRARIRRSFPAPSGRGSGGGPGRRPARHGDAGRQPVAQRRRLGRHRFGKCARPWG